MNKDEMLVIHRFYSLLADEFDFELDGDYRKFDVFKNNVKHTKNDHRIATHLLTKELADGDFEPIHAPLETWDKGLEKHEEGSVTYFSSSRERFVFEDEEGFYTHTMPYSSRNGKPYKVLETLAEGEELASAISSIYDDPNDLSVHKRYEGMEEKVLENGLLPEPYRSDLRSILEKDDLPINDKLN